jgi:AraC-like DNA-binding protein
MPDGCVDVVFAFGSGGGAPLAMAVGAMTRPVIFADSSDISYVGVRFRSGVAGTLFGMPASDLTDERPDLGDVWPHAAVLRDKLTLSEEMKQRLDVVATEIAGRLLAAPVAPPPLVLVAAERIAVSRGRIAIRALASDLGVTRQHLARAFAQHVGLSPKMLARVVRARGVVDHVRKTIDLHNGVDVDWSTLAIDAGYYDQSHLIAELKELTGLSPGAWVSAQA